MTMGALDLLDSMQSVDSRSSCPPGVRPKLMSSLTAHAVQVSSLTRATAANLIPVDSHRTSSSVGTACSLPTAAMSRAISSAESPAGRGESADKSRSLHRRGSAIDLRAAYCGNLALVRDNFWRRANPDRPWQDSGVGCNNLGQYSGLIIEKLSIRKHGEDRRSRRTGSMPMRRCAH